MQFNENLVHTNLMTDSAKQKYFFPIKILLLFITQFRYPIKSPIIVN
jgi:hypothetical protein